MTGRYEIQDILTQDADGVVYHAGDRETGKSVVLRRFFPYGPDGGGLQEAERNAYMAALDRLRNVRHPTLRTILDGGCDPVDGMPFLVAEWVEGQRLSELLRERPLSPGSTKALVTHALEASMAIAAAFGEEAVWVETAAESIVLPSDGGSLTFWACPLKWLGSPEKRDGLLPLARLAEKALHWRAKPVAGTAEGLGSWVKAVRENPDAWTLEEALAALQEPMTIRSLPTQKGIPTVPMPGKREKAAGAGKRSFVPVLLAILVGAAAVGGGYYFLKSRADKGAELAESRDTIEVPKGTSALDFATRSQTRDEPAAPPTPVAAVPDGPAKAGETSVTGRVITTETSKTGKTRYLKIAADGGKAPNWVAYEVSGKAKDMEAADFEKLRDKRVRVRGVEKPERSHRRSVIRIQSRDQIEQLD